MDKPLSSVNFILLGTVFSISICSWFVFGADFIYSQYDAYYYASVADNLISGKGFSVGSSIPSDPVLTPQNGVVVFHWLFNMMGVSSIEMRLILISFVNSIVLVFSALFIYKLALNLKIDPLVSLLTAISIPVSFYYHAVLLQSINDIYYFSGCFAILYLSSTPNFKKYQWFIIVLALMLPLFRIAGIIVFISLVLAAIMLKDKERFKYWLMPSVVTVMMLLFAMFVQGLVAGGSGEHFNEILQRSGFEYWSEHLIKTIVLSLPETFIRFSWFTMKMSITEPLIGVLISVILLVVLIRAMFASIKEKQFVWLALSLFVALNLVFFQVFYAQPTRYIITIGPILLLLIFKLIKNVKICRMMSASYLLMTLLIAGLAFGKTILPDDAKHKKQYADDIKGYLKDSPSALHSYYPRVTYFLTGQSSYNSVAIACQQEGAEHILVVGPIEFIRYAINTYIDMGHKPSEQYFLPFRYFGYVGSKEPVFYSVVDRVEVLSIRLKCDNLKI